MTNSKITLDKIKKNVKFNLDDVDSNPGIYEKVFNYTGNSQEFIAPYSGWYQIELWGAQGGSYDAIYVGGLGAYTYGTITLAKNDTLYVYVGGQNLQFNGGGVAVDALSPYNTGNQKYGGGATDVRLVIGTWSNVTSLRSRVMIAAGGGAGAYGNGSNYMAGGAGGGINGLVGTNMAEHTSSVGRYGTGGTQLAAGYAYQSSSLNVGNFGVGGSGYGGGGGGFYGGGGAGGNSTSAYGGGGGGSSFISGYPGCNAINESGTHTNQPNHYSGKYFIDGKMEVGVNEGNGKAKITFISQSKPATKNTKLNNVQYIKDCINGNTVNGDNYWVELQAIKDGINIAKEKTVSGTSTISNSSYITDGDITSTNYAGTMVGSLQCITVDLGVIYDLDEIAVWHYWIDGRTYNGNITSVSLNNVDWTTVIDKIETETANGKRVSVYD